ncbi:hypothetical protein COCSADRAFT_34060 [Bipolaris sorokiniana ND90Pr]|uniref:Uncharacterized protein n=1 Tax=Cochliobolus sativus (strain ND90Pr / ATCC 201652) TaxID=665912 RepID=M2SJ36_COCSN|nr:uncharacterized protein COCSADRAFT_34060 [Bipolaris sorokiniana ND90Pr]EMD67203.1 hypothetical protein COCSADRAFT_34060 [Bipolaris sorokiniana ND90Pr]
MAPVSLHPSSHPFLTPTRASDISSWTLSVPERSSSSSTESITDAQSRQAAIEAYRQMKAALFSRSLHSNLSRST